MTSALAELEQVLRDRQRDRPEGSYTTTLFADPELTQRKIMEEAFETCLELGRGDIDRARLVSEASDLVFHLVVALVANGCSFADVQAELAERRR